MLHGQFARSTRSTLGPAWDHLRRLAVSLRQPTLASNNEIAAFLFGVLPAAFGSAFSVTYVVYGVWAMASLLLRRYEFRLDGVMVAVALALSAYPLTLLATALLAGSADLGPDELAKLLGFALVWFVFARFAAASTKGHMDTMILGAAIGCMISLALAAVQKAAGFRPEGGAGNADVFGAVIACTSVVSLFGLARRPEYLARIGLAGYLCGATALALSGVRTGMIAFVATSLVAFAFLYLDQISRPRMRLSFLAIGAIIVLPVLAVLAMPSVMVAYEEMRAIYLLGDFSQSFGHRILLWQSAIQAFLDSPWVGHGMQNRMPAILAQASADYREAISFNHPHNAFLQAAVDGGVVAITGMLVTLFGPAIILWRNRGANAQPAQIMVCLTVLYAVAGFALLIFGHDIMDSVFLLGAIHLTAIATGQGYSSDANAPGTL